MKALEKDVRHRYASAGELAADLRRFLRLEPIHAAPAGLVTRAVKRIRRHRRAAALVAVAVASLAALWIAAAVGDASARARARQELAAAATARRAGDLTAALDHARAAVQQAPGDPAVQAEHEVYRELWRQEQRLRATKAEWIESLRLLTLSQQVRDTDPGFALLLAVEGSRRAPELLFERSMANDALLQALGGLRELRTLTGHLEGVTAACFDARGETVVTAGVDWTARLWDARDGRQRAVLGGHRDVVHAVAFDPTGKRVVTASADRTARVWDVGREAVDLVLRGHRGAVRCARFAPDGATIATGGDDGTVRIWDAATGEPRHRLDAHAAAVRALDFAADGTRLVTGSDDRTFRMLDLGTGETSFVSTPEQSGIVSVALDRAARRVAVASGGSARVWNLVRGEFEARLAAPATPNNFVVSVAFGSDGRVAAACWDGVARVLDESGAVLELRGHQRQVDSIAFSPDATRVVTASADGTARIWSVVTDPAAETPRVFGPDVRAAVFRPDGEVLALSSRTSGRIRLHATGTGELVGTLATGDRARLLPPATFSAAGDRVLAPASDHSVRISTPAGADEVVLGPHGGAVCSATFDPTGEHVATVALDDVVRLWDSRRGDLLANWPAGGARRVRFLANGRLCGLPAGVFGYHDPADDRWHLTGPSPVRTFERDAAGTVTTPVPDDVMMAAVGSDGARLVAVRGNETVLVDMATGKQLAVLAAIGAATHTGFSADGRLVVLCMLDAVAFVHDSTDGARLLTLTGHQKPLTFAEFDRGATRVVTASMDGTARTWDCRSGSEQSVLRHGAAVVFCHYSPCGRFVSTVGFDGTARLWPARPLDAAETRRPRELTADDRRRAALWSDAERAAAALVARLFEERDTLAAVTAAIVDDPSLAEPVRAAALEQARAHGDRPWRLERAAWAVARSPSSSGAELAVARRRAAAAVGLVQDHAPFLSTLGAACYRLGELAEAERCLAAAAAADPAPPVALAFLAMTRHRRGATDSACATLARLDALLPDPEDHELAALCSEARALLSR
jgi:WD40 repeat protein